MGAVPPRPPLPPTATREEMMADLARIRKEIAHDAAWYGASLFVGLVAGLAAVALALLAG